MAKKVRVARSSHRPGGQGPSRSKKTAGAAAGASAQAAGASVGSELETATEGIETVEAEYTEITLADPQPATGTTPVAATTKRRRTRRRNKSKADDLTARVAAENVWVREDLRRIGIISVVLLAALAVAWILFYAMDVLSLY